MYTHYCACTRDTPPTRREGGEKRKGEERREGEKRTGEERREKGSREEKEGKREETNLLEYLEPRLSAFIKFPLFFCRASSSFTSLSILVIEVGIGSTVGNAGERGVRDRVHCRERWGEGC